MSKADSPAATPGVDREIRTDTLSQSDQQILRDVDDHRLGLETGCVVCGAPGADHLTSAGLTCEDCCDCPDCTDDPDETLLQQWRAFILRVSPLGGGG